MRVLRVGAVAVQQARFGASLGGCSGRENQVDCVVCKSLVINEHKSRDTIISMTSLARILLRPLLGAVRECHRPAAMYYPVSPSGHPNPKCIGRLLASHTTQRSLLSISIIFPTGTASGQSSNLGGDLMSLEYSSSSSAQ